MKQITESIVAAMAETKKEGNIQLGGFATVNNEMNVVQKENARPTQQKPEFIHSWTSLGKALTNLRSLRQSTTRIGQWFSDSFDGIETVAG